MIYEEYAYERGDCSDEKECLVAYDAEDCYCYEDADGCA